MAISSTGDALGKLILRLTLGVLILFHGVAKIYNPAMLQSVTRQVVEAGLPPALAYGVYVGEVIAPLMIVLGIYSRIGGLIVAGNMVFAIYLAHASQFFTLSRSAGWALELQALYLMCGMAVFFLGSGRAALKPD